ncbi:hypothetical protein [Roseococcus sp. YIM B11640]|uniref:hypothetical protein n=1 Tax=Roseococcus sp. YIM B11640 TaxID=3133973 RepID=UPI003C7B10AC
MSTTLSPDAMNAIWLHSDLALWMRHNHGDLSALAANGDLDWEQAAGTFQRDGTFAGLGDLPTPALLQDTWDLVTADLRAAA